MADPGYHSTFPWCQQPKLAKIVHIDVVTLRGFPVLASRQRLSLHRLKH